MCYGLSGAHRTGKSTLAKRVAELLHMPYVEYHGSAIFARLHLDPKQKYGLETRMDSGADSD